MKPAQAYRAALKAAPKPRKYRNTPVVRDSIRFDSVKEANRYAALQLLERAGEISELERQVTFRIEVNGFPICRYVSDFTYRDAKGARVIEDVKSPATRKLPAYRIKAKLMAAIHGEITEV